MEYVEDQDNALTFNDILQLSPQEFTQISPNEANKGISNSIYWLKVTLQTDYEQTDKIWVLEQLSPLTDQISIFIPSNSQQYSMIENGDSLSYNNRPFKFTNLTFEFSLPPQQKNTVFLRISTRSSLALAFNLRSYQAFKAYSASFYLVNGLYYGVLMVMLIYNLFLFFSIKEKTYFIYTLHILFFGIFIVTIDGFGAQYLWPNTTWINSNGLLFNASVSIFFILLFTKVALLTHKFSPASNLILNIEIFLLAVACAVAILIKTPEVLRAYSFLMGIFCISVFFISIRVYLAGNKSARFFILAWGLFSTSLFLSSASIAGVIPYTPITAYYQKIGSFLEVLLLSFALADRIKTLTIEKSYLGHKTKLILKSSNAYLERTNLMKHEFLATISHELRTPMNGVQGALELMQEKEIPDYLQEYVGIAIRSSNQMINMIDDILLFTEIQSGGIKINNSQINLPQFITKLCAPYKLACEEKSIQFEYVPPANSTEYIIADPMILEHILGPILDNAVRFTAKGYIQLKITTHTLEHAKEKAEFKFIVSDTGPGIEKNRTKEIMQAFTQLDGSHSREFGGLGVGLSMSRQLAHTLGGQLTVESTLGAGSVFSVASRFCVIACPDHLSPANQEEYSELAPSTPPSPEDHTILIAEDNLVNQLVIKKLVTGMGYRTITANDGNQTLQQLKTNTVDLILMDCQMPIMDGYQTTEAIRAMPQPLSTTPIIAVTANVMTEDQQRCFRVGMNDYLKKPINKKLLEDRIAHWLTPENVTLDQQRPSN